MAKGCGYQGMLEFDFQPELDSHERAEKWLPGSEWRVILDIGQSMFFVWCSNDLPVEKYLRNNKII